MSMAASESGFTGHSNTRKPAKRKSDSTSSRGSAFSWERDA